MCRSTALPVQIQRVVALVPAMEAVGAHLEKQVKALEG